MHHSVFTALITLVAANCAIAKDLETGPSAPVAETQDCRVTRVTDGDSIECRGVGRVRLLGMDAPELSQDPHGGRAREALSALLGDGTNVVIELDVEHRDAYGRLLAYVWVGDLMVNWALVRQGWTVVLTYPPNVQYVDWLVEAQRLAREDGVGLWETGGFDCLPRDHRGGRC